MSTRWRVGETRILQWWPHGQPLPEGAEMVSHEPDHHGGYSILIRRRDIEEQDAAR